MYSNAGLGIVQKLLLDQAEPLFHQLRVGGRPVVKGQLGGVDPGLTELFDPIGGLSGRDQVGNAVFFQNLNVVVDGSVLGLLGDQKSHGLELDFGRSRTDQLAGHLVEAAAADPENHNFANATVNQARPRPGIALPPLCSKDKSTPLETSRLTSTLLPCVSSFQRWR